MGVHSKDFHLALFLAGLSPAQKNAIDKMADEIETQGHPYLLLLLTALLYYADPQRYDASGTAVIDVDADDGETIAMPESGAIARSTLDRLWPEWERVVTL